MRPLRDKFKPADYPPLLVGLGEPDDAAVYRVNDSTALIQTLDFFPPVVDDAYVFGAVAAANAMSDVYAMGGRVVLALNLAAWRDDLPIDLLGDIFRGAADKMAEGGGVIAGGHTITDDEPKFGLSVTGLVDPNRVIKKGGARAGDILVLTKPLGTGLITTAGKNSVVSPQHLHNAIDWMTRLNRGAALAMQEIGIRGATDITGYGLLGHAYEMALAADLGFHLRADALPLLDGALEYAAKHQIPGGAGRNKLYLEGKVQIRESIPADLNEILFDPQTSGGLLIAVPPDRQADLERALEAHGASHWAIGEALQPTDDRIQTSDKAVRILVT
ncbi:MAG: selenide, water dikinase SelD [Chloroflexi bacterium]|nr:selenide, water dikinase SelD [Chloroflexota bacterium]